MICSARRAAVAAAVAGLVGLGLSACAAGSGASATPPGSGSSSSRPTTRVATSSAAGLAPFVGTWNGHTRRLIVHPDGSGTEASNAGCCTRAAYLSFHLDDASGDASDARATLTVTRVRVWDPSAFTPTRPAPRVGQKAVVHLRDGVLTEPVTSLTYCGPSAMARGRCGA